MQLFSADATIFLKKSEFFFVPQNMKKPPSKVAHNQPQFFSVCIANWPKISPNLILCSIIMAPCATSI